MIFISEEHFNEIIRAGEFLDRKGWVPATSGNISILIDRDRIAITASGRHKGRLSERDIVVVDMNGYKIYGEGKPSAEVLLHTMIYKVFPNTKAVVHAHSPNATVLSKLMKGESIKLESYEILKAFEDIDTHEIEIEVPVFKNDQDIKRLRSRIEEWIKKNRNKKIYGFVLEAHGIYTWSNSMERALNYMEAFEFLFECELKLRRFL